MLETFAANLRRGGLEITSETDTHIGFTFERKSYRISKADWPGSIAGETVFEYVNRIERAAEVVS